MVSFFSLLMILFFSSALSSTPGKCWLVTNTYQVPLSQIKETGNKPGTNLNFVMKHLNVI